MVAVNSYFVNVTFKFILKTATVARLGQRNPGCDIHKSLKIILKTLLSNAKEWKKSERSIERTVTVLIKIVWHFYWMIIQNHYSFISPWKRVWLFSCSPKLCDLGVRRRWKCEYLKKTDIWQKTWNQNSSLDVSTQDLWALRIYM